MKNASYRVEYFFNHSQMGFSNSITVEAPTEKHAIVMAMEAVKECYGSKMYKKFTVKDAKKIN